MNTIDVYCGYYRDTIVRVRYRLVEDIVLEIDCMECGGTGIWNYFPEEFGEEACVACKGTGRQLLRI